MVIASDAFDFRHVWEELTQWGVLLESDSVLPSVAGIVARSRIRGSWWGHPCGRAIFRATRQLAAHPEVLIAKIISGKLTYVHQRHWSACVAVFTSGEPWQVTGLSLKARALLSYVAKEGLVRTDQVFGPGRRKVTGVPVAARQLEKRLLIHTEELHTEVGAHAKNLESWDYWTQRVGLRGRKMKVARAKQELENVVRRLNAAFEGSGKLPWPSVGPADWPS